MVDMDKHNLTVNNAQDALAFAYQYGYPVLSYVQMSGGYGVETNHLYHGRDLATAADRNLVRPNVDTIYSTIFYDLSASDVTITIPEIKDRYWVFPFYDLYGDNFANVSSLQDHPAGVYLLSYTNDDFGIHLCESGSQYAGYINSPTTYGLSLIRILVFNRGPDFQKAKNYMQQTQVECPASPIARRGPKLDLAHMQSIINTRELTEAQQVLTLLALVHTSNPPQDLACRNHVASTLSLAGISDDGSFTTPPNASLEAAEASATAHAIHLRTFPGQAQHLGNQWTRTSPHILGTYGSNFAARHITAIRGYLALTADQAIYPVYTAGDKSMAYRCRIGSDEAFLVTFSRKPLMRETGFWSITAYDADGFLIDNPLSRYVVGDRTGLRWPDGQLLYGLDEDDDGKEERDGPFQILVQPADIVPPEEWMCNWLPAPARGGDFSFSMRLYGARPEMTDGSWEFPHVERVAAIWGSV